MSIAPLIGRRLGACSFFPYLVSCSFDKSTIAFVWFPFRGQFHPSSKCRCGDDNNRHQRKGRKKEQLKASPSGRSAHKLSDPHRRASLIYPDFRAEKPQTKHSYHLQANLCSACPYNMFCKCCDSACNACE